MRATTNEKLIERQSKIARYCTLGGMAVLMGSLITTFTNSVSILVSYVLLFFGFGLAYVGAVLANKWIKEPRADSALAKALKGFDNKYHLYNYVLPAAHVLSGPNGLLIFKVKKDAGQVSCNQENWRQGWQWSRLFGGMGREPLGNPALELRQDISKIKALITDRFEGAGTIPLDGYVVFIDPAVQLSLENPTVPVLMVDELKDTLRKAKHGAPLSPKLLEGLKNTLDQAADAKTA